MSRPWMPLYINDYRLDADKLTTAEFGAYMLLVMSYWYRGALPVDEKQIACIACCLDPKEWKKLRPAVAAMFGPCWTHAKLDIERLRKHPGHFLGAPISEDLRMRGPQWTKLRRSIFQRDNFTCGYCGYIGGELECDHVLPISRGGGHETTNLQTACKPCNRSKRDKTLAEWQQ